MGANSITITASGPEPLVMEPRIREAEAEAPPTTLCERLRVLEVELQALRAEVQKVAATRPPRRPLSNREYLERVYRADRIIKEIYAKGAWSGKDSAKIQDEILDRLLDE